MIELIITAVFAAALLADVDERPSRKRINRLRHIYEYKKYDKVCSRPGCTDMRDIRGARQHMSAPDIIKALITGFAPQDAELAAVMSGGGIVSMLRVAAIVCISASYAGIFDGTGFLEGIRTVINKLCIYTQKYSPYRDISCRIM